MFEVRPCRGAGVTLQRNYCKTEPEVRTSVDLLQRGSSKVVEGKSMVEFRLKARCGELTAGRSPLVPPTLEPDGGHFPILNKGWFLELPASAKLRTGTSPLDPIAKWSH